MGRIIAISGGDLKSNKAINEYMIKMVEKVKTNFLFIGTASGDAEGYIDNIQKTFTPLGCDVKALRLVTQEYTDGEINELLSWADIIYVGGGDTFSMMEVWKKYGLDTRLKEIYEKDRAILAGISAGAMCWFHCGHSDSEIFWKDGEMRYGWVNDLLDIYPLAYCPHYEERVDSVNEMIKEKGMSGLAMESDTAFVEENGKEYYIKSNPVKKVYLLRCKDGKVRKDELEVKLV